MGADYGALAEGLQRGFSIGMSIHQMKNQENQRQIENTRLEQERTDRLEQVQFGKYTQAYQIEYSKTMMYASAGLPERALETWNNNVAPILSKMFPDVGPQTMEVWPERDKEYYKLTKNKLDVARTKGVPLYTLKNELFSDIMGFVAEGKIAPDELAGVSGMVTAATAPTPEEEISLKRAEARGLGEVNIDLKEDEIRRLNPIQYEQYKQQQDYSFNQRIGAAYIEGNLTLANQLKMEMEQQKNALDRIRETGKVEVDTRTKIKEKELELNKKFGVTEGGELDALKFYSQEEARAVDFLTEQMKIVQLQGILIDEEQRELRMRSSMFIPVLVRQGTPASQAWVMGTKLAVNEIVKDAISQGDFKRAEKYQKVWGWIDRKFPETTETNLGSSIEDQDIIKRMKADGFTDEEIAREFQRAGKIPHTTLQAEPKKDKPKTLVTPKKQPIPRYRP